MSKTSKKKGTTKKKTSSSKTKPKKKTTTKKAPSKKKALVKKKLPVKKKPAKKKTVKKKKTPTKKKIVSTDEIAMLNELEAETRSSDEQVSLGAIERLGILENPQATQVLIDALSDSRYIVRIHAAAQLGERRDKKSVDALIASLKDDSVFVRQTIAGALENIGGTKAKKAVSKAEDDGLLLDELPEGKRLIE